MVRRRAQEGVIRDTGDGLHRMSSSLSELVGVVHGSAASLDAHNSHHVSDGRVSPPDAGFDGLLTFRRAGWTCSLNRSRDQRHRSVTS